MTPERYSKLIERIMDEGEILDNHFRENPELAHFIRAADGISTIVSFGYCGATRQHWNCLVATSSVSRYLFALATIKPRVLDEIWEEFKEDFQALIPEGMLLYRVIESREYPVPPELAESSQEPY